jgi:hypothetical protein
MSDCKHESIDPYDCYCDGCGETCGDIIESLQARIEELELAVTECDGFNCCPLAPENTKLKARIEEELEQKNAALYHCLDIQMRCSKKDMTRIEELEAAVGDVTSPIFAMSKSNQERTYGALFLEALYRLDEIVKGSMLRGK